MPKVTANSGGYEDPRLIRVINNLRAASEALQKGESVRLCEWLKGKFTPESGGLDILAVFAGGGSNELGFALSNNVERLVISDGAKQGVASVAHTLSTISSKHPILAKTVDYMCLGVSFFHLPTSNARMTTLRQFYAMLQPGGYLFLDNKNWNGALEEERDPTTVYTAQRRSVGCYV